MISFLSSKTVIRSMCQLPTGRACRFVAALIDSLTSESISPNFLDGALTGLRPVNGSFAPLTIGSLTGARSGWPSEFRRANSSHRTSLSLSANLRLRRRVGFLGHFS